MSFSFSKLTTASAISASEQLISHALSYSDEPNHVQLMELTSSVLAKKEVAQSSLAISRLGEYTEELISDDDACDDAFDFFHDSASLASRHRSNSDIANGGKKVFEVIEKHGTNIPRLGRQEQIGNIEALVTEMESSAISPYVTIAGLSGDLTELKQRNQKLKDTLLKSSRIEAAKKAKLSPSYARKALTKSISDLYSFTEILHRAGNSDYSSLLLRMDETLNKFRAGLDS